MSTASIDEYHLPAMMKSVIKKLSARQGVIGVVLVDPDGLTLDTSMDQLQAEIISGWVQILISKAKETAKTVKGAGEIVSMAVEADSKEILITPDTEGKFTIVVLREKEKY